MHRPISFLMLPISLAAVLAACAPRDADTPPVEVEARLSAELTGQTAEMKVPAADEGARSLFQGRCSIPSDWVIRFTMAGRDEALGEIRGEAAHCSQVLTWLTVDGVTAPDSVTYGNGEFTLVTVVGDTLRGTYGSGVGASRPDGTIWFRDAFLLTGGSGRYAQASGSGTDEGTFVNPEQPFTMRMQGALRYPAR